MIVKMDNLYKFSDIIFNPTSVLRYMYIRPLFTIITGLDFYIKQDATDGWVMVDENHR